MAGGGLSSGIASAVRAIKPDVRVFAAEVETAAPFAASLAQGSPATIDSTPSFVDGIGGKGVYLEFFPTHLPARSAFGASGLALGARVEIEAVALVA